MNPKQISKACNTQSFFLIHIILYIFSIYSFLAYTASVIASIISVTFVLCLLTAAILVMCIYNRRKIKKYYVRWILSPSQM